MSKKCIQIDGAQGEGGGQVLRTSLALSLINGQPFHLRNIRAGRAKPGLHAQHLMCVKAAAKIGNAKLRGASLGSTDLTFEPGSVKPGDYHFAIGTAGATSLVLHTIYLPLALAGGESNVVIEGGTHVRASPCYHFIERTWAAYMRVLGLSIHVTLDKIGFYPRGGGIIRARIQSAQQVHPFHGMTATKVDRANIVAVSAGLPEHVAQRLIKRAANRLTELGLDVQSRIEAFPGGPGCILGIELPIAPAPTFCFALGERGKAAEQVADEVADEVARFLTGPIGVDEHSADQLLLPLTLADGPSEFRVKTVSSHLVTNAEVIRHFIGRAIAFESVKGEAPTVRIV